MIYVCNVPGLKKWDEPEQIQNILQDLEKYRNRIVGLELCHNSIGEKCAKALGEKIKNLKYLRKVNLSDCFVSRGTEELPKSLKYLLDSLIDKNILELHLSNNALGPQASSGYNLFFQKNKTLEKLYLDDCGMGPEGTRDLMKILKNNKDISLKVLKISSNNMQDEGCISICELLKEKRNIKEIKISHNRIKYKGLESFLDSIKDNKNISWIDIHDNTLNDQGKSLPDIISTLENVYYLDLSDLTIGNKEIIKKVFEILPKLNELRVFHFEYNISDLDFSKDKSKFISELFECLLKVNHLKEVHLGNNDISKDLYNKYLPQFKKKGLYLFSCSSEEEEMDDNMGDDIDMADLNKK